MVGAATVATVRSWTFAGLWEKNDYLGIESCAIIVTAANRLMRPIHDRMPVILAPEDWAAWLAEPRKDLLRPAPEDELIAYPVRSDIRDDDPPETLAPPEGMRIMSSGLIGTPEEAE